VGGSGFIVVPTPSIPMAAQAFRHHIFGKPLPTYAGLKLTPTLEPVIPKFELPNNLTKSMLRT